eukprot:Pgem_evm3s12513
MNLKSKQKLSLEEYIHLFNFAFSYGNVHMYDFFKEKSLTIKDLNFKNTFHVKTYKFLVEQHNFSLDNVPWYPILVNLSSKVECKQWFITNFRKSNDNITFWDQVEIIENIIDHNHKVMTNEQYITDNEDFRFAKVCLRLVFDFKIKEPIN